MFWCKLGGVFGGESDISESEEDDGDDMMVFLQNRPKLPEVV